MIARSRDIPRSFRCGCGDARGVLDRICLVAVAMKGVPLALLSTNFASVLSEHDPDRAPGGSELDGVGQKIDNDLLDAIAIRVEVKPRIRCFDLESDLVWVATSSKAQGDFLRSHTVLQTLEYMNADSTVAKSGRRSTHTCSMESLTSMQDQTCWRLGFRETFASIATSSP